MCYKSVADSLVGQKVERFGRASTMIKQALAAAVESVLTPKRSTDVPGRSSTPRGRARPTPSFLWASTAWASTSLSKVAYYLKEHNIDVMITACDTLDRERWSN